MRGLNVKVENKKVMLEIKQIVARYPGFVEFVDQNGNAQKVFKVDLLPRDWARIGPGSTIEVYVREMLSAIKVLASKPDMFMTSEWQKIPVPGYLWACQECQKRGVVGYQDGDDMQVVVDHIFDNHNTKSPECSADFHIYNHLFEEQYELERLLSFQGVSQDIPF